VISKKEQPAAEKESSIREEVSLRERYLSSMGRGFFSEKGNPCRLGEVPRRAKMAGKVTWREGWGEASEVKKDSSEKGKC
jgi:hypothetical protein